MSNVVVLYHANCSDGTGAKYAAWKKYGDAGALYIPVQYNKPIPDIVENGSGKEIYMVDFSYPRDVILKLREQHKKVMIIDHHKTAEADLKGLSDCIFDMTKSGAVLSWEYFHPEEPVPIILKHVQDRDLWLWKMEGTKEIVTGLTQLGGDMKLWNNWKLDTLYKSGKAICDYIDQKVDSATKEDRIRFTTFKGFKIGLVNANDHGSEICQAIYSKYPQVDIASSYFIDPEGSVILSLRSDNKRMDAIDVSAIAKEHNGGGHKNAAGCKVDLAFLQALLKGEK